MKSLLLTLITVLPLTLFAQPWKVDITSSKVKWTGHKLTSNHWGHVKISEGNVIMQDGKLKTASVTVNMDSITCVDVTDPNYNKKLVDHLKNDDFFSTSKFNTAKIILTSVKPGAKPGTYKLKADLTIKGQTKPVTFDAVQVTKDNKTTFTANVKFDRTKYGIKYNSGNFFKDLGDKLIKDVVDLDITLVANKNVVAKK